MFCKECGDRMQRETVVLIRRGVRRRSVAQVGWYCWACKTSTRSPDDVAEAASVRLRAHRLSGLSMLRQWVAPAFISDRPAAILGRSR